MKQATLPLNGRLVLVEAELAPSGRNYKVYPVQDIGAFSYPAGPLPHDLQVAGACIMRGWEEETAQPRRWALVSVSFFNRLEQAAWSN